MIHFLTLVPFISALLVYSIANTYELTHSNSTPSLPPFISPSILHSLLCTNTTHTHIYIILYNYTLNSEPCPRLELAKIMIGLENASHVSSKNAEVIKCVAFRLQPLSPGSCNDLDGEVIEAGPVQAHVMPSAMNIFHR